MNKAYYSDPDNKERIKIKARERYYKNRDRILAMQKAKRRLLKYLTDKEMEIIKEEIFQK